jgi:ABC-type phosphate transport system substrate-binding protein
MLLKPERQGDSRLAQPEFTGFVSGIEYKPYSRRQRRKWAVAAVGVVLVVSVVVSVVVVGLLASKSSARVYRPLCGSGIVSFKGSTAFAPIVNEAVALYQQYCPHAQITVRAIGSENGLSALITSPVGSRVVAMYDGQPSSGMPPGYVSRPVGVVIFAVVGNKWLSARFTTGHGMTIPQIAHAFADPGRAKSGFVPVGRTTVSGTRQAFVQDVLGGNDTSEHSAGPCPPTNKNSVCLEDTTMDLLTYVNRKRYSIGYAEADALIFFPNIREIPIYGHLPTRTNALDGKYTFVATEHLYTRGTPTGLTADFINFLTSSTVTAEMRRYSFIGCSDLRAALSGACSPG